jgi:hypothetical protein
VSLFAVVFAKSTIACMVWCHCICWNKRNTYSSGVQLIMNHVAFIDVLYGITSSSFSSFGVPYVSVVVVTISYNATIASVLLL